MKKKTLRKTKKWTKEEDNLLITLKKNKVPLKIIAEQINRSEDSASNRWHRLKVLESAAPQVKILPKKNVKFKLSEFAVPEKGPFYEMLEKIVRIYHYRYDNRLGFMLDGKPVKLQDMFKLVGMTLGKGD